MEFPQIYTSINGDQNLFPSELSSVDLELNYMKNQILKNGFDEKSTATCFEYSYHAAFIMFSN